TPLLAERLAAIDPRVRVVRKANGGVSSARNAGLAAAQGELFCFLDADDMLLPDKLRRQVEFLQLFPSCDLVFSDYYVGDSRLVPYALSCRSPPLIPLPEVFVYLNWFGPPFTPLLRRSLQERVGGFDETLRSAEDWDYWLRASRSGTFSYQPGPSGVYRQHPNQAIKNHERMRSYQGQVIDKSFRRGSREWRIATGSRAFTYAQWHYGRSQYGHMLWELGRSAWYARSLRTVRTIRALCGA
ncbi:MAG TPA: glycosyltransferase, partial [Acidimicrobiales bacterium]|nr:glycosyltransferase [Acidimicrobiales bacterium]